MDLGPGDVHRDGAVKRTPRSKLGPRAAWVYGGRCAACSSGVGHDPATKACLVCLGEFFQVPGPGGPASVPVERRAPTGVPEPGGSEDPGTWVSLQQAVASVFNEAGATRESLAASAERMKMRTRHAAKTMISAAKRRGLQPSQFALPEKRAYPIDTAARVRNAAARLEQNKSSLTPAEYRRARAAIARAAKRFGVASEYNRPKGGKRAAAEQPGGSPSKHGPVHVSVTHHPGGTRRMELMLASDRVVRCEGVPVALVDVFARLAEAEQKLRDVPEGSESLRAEAEAAVRKLADEAAAPRWNQIAKVGSFRGHPAGPFQLRPEVEFEEIIRNFHGVDGGRVPIDFEHASEAEESAGSIPVSGAPAQGWVTDLQNRGAEGLWGLTTFLEPALTYVREGRYRTVSPAIRFGAKHPESGQPIGARLTSVALVTRPFLRDMQPLAARDGEPGAQVTTTTPSTGETTTMPDVKKLDDKHPHEMMASLKRTMGLHPLATGEDMKAHLDKLRDHTSGVADKPHGHAMGHVSAGGVSCGEYIAPMADLMNASADMTTSDLLDAVESLIDGAMAIHEATEHNMGDAGDVLKLGERLGRAEGETKRLASENAALLRDRDALTLAGQQKDARITVLEAAIAAKDGELTTLRDAETKRQNEQVTARVREAFDTYKDVQKLTDMHLPMMERHLRADEPAFDKLYPKVPPNQRHLMQNLTGSRTPTGSTGTTAMGDRPAPVTAPSAATDAPAVDAGGMRNLVDKLVKERGMPREAAVSVAYQVSMGKMASPFAS